MQFHPHPTFAQFENAIVHENTIEKFSKFNSIPCVALFSIGYRSIGLYYFTYLIFTLLFFVVT